MLENFTQLTDQHLVETFGDITMTTTKTDIAKTVKGRKSLHGTFIDNAATSQAIKVAMKDTKNWEKLPPEMKEALEMIALKISRILTGDPTVQDTWHDIQGYAKLVELALQGIKQ